MTIPVRLVLVGRSGRRAGRESDRLLDAAAPITVWDLEDATFNERGALFAAAPTADLDLGKGRLTSAPLAAAPITNFFLGAGGSGNVVPLDPITTWTNINKF